MIDAKFIESLAKQLDDAIPDSIKQLHQDSLQQFKLILQSQLTKLDLVSREEFDVQVKLLEQMQLKIIELEKRISDLEER